VPGVCCFCQLVLHHSKDSLHTSRNVSVQQNTY
jgi:hypothetical protein